MEPAVSSFCLNAFSSLVSIFVQKKARRRLTRFNVYHVKRSDVEDRKDLRKPSVKETEKNVPTVRSYVEYELF